MLFIYIYVNSNLQAVKESLTKNNHFVLHTLYRLTLTPHLNRKLVQATVKLRFSSEEEPKGLL